MAMKCLFSKFALILVPTLLFAGAPFKNQSNSGFSGIMLDPDFHLNTGIAPLFDPSRMQWSHQVSYGVTSGSGGSLGQGLFMNTLQYRLGAHSEMRVHLGMLNTTFNSYNPDATGSDFLGGAEFSWHPKDNLHVELGFYRGVAPNSRSVGYPGFSNGIGSGIGGW